MQCPAFAEFAKFLQLQASLDGLLILARLIRNLAALGALKFCEGVLGHRIILLKWLRPPGLRMTAPNGCGVN